MIRTKNHNLTLEVGYVYVMTNEHIPDLLKIGMTTRTPEERSAELSSTGVPGRWNVQYSIFVPNCEKIEKKVHKTLNEYRLSEDREFFKIEISLAIQAIESHAQTLISCFPGWPNIENVTLFIENELARIKDENAKRVEQYRLEKQAWLIEVEKQKQNEKAQAFEAEIIRKKNELESIDISTIKDIKKGKFGWPDYIWIFIGLFLFAKTDVYPKLIHLLWLFLFIYGSLIWSRVVESKSAIELRKKFGLPKV